MAITPFTVCGCHKLSDSKKRLVVSQALPVRPCLVLHTILKLCKQFTGRSPTLLFPSHQVCPFFAISQASPHIQFLFFKILFIYS